jgi:hypothetical protein
MPKILIKPATADMVVRDPDDSMTPIPVGGKAVEDSTYWQRRLGEGDVVITTTVLPPPPAPPQPDPDTGNEP